MGSQARQRQRDAYRAIYDVLMSPDLHRGRWMIVDIGEGRKKVPERERDEPDFLLIYRTLGVFSALATYIEHGIVPRDLALKVWRHALLEMKKGAEIIRDEEIARYEGSRGKDWTPWPDLWELYKGL
jgi:hypothetical protein